MKKLIIVLVSIGFLGTINSFAFKPASSENSLSEQKRYYSYTQKQRLIRKSRHFLEVPGWVYRELKRIEKKLFRLKRRVDRLYHRKRRVRVIRFSLNRRIANNKREILKQDMRKRYLMRKYFR